MATTAFGSSKNAKVLHVALPSLSMYH